MLVVHGKEKSAALQTRADLEVALTVESRCTLPVPVFLIACLLFSLILRAVIAINERRSSVMVNKAEPCVLRYDANDIPDSRVHGRLSGYSIVKFHACAAKGYRKLV